MPTGSLELYSDHVGKMQSCQLPLLSTCSRTAPSRDERGYCWFDNQDSGLCDESLPVVNVCDAVELAGGSDRLCPCKPEDEDGWFKQSTSAPSPYPTSSPSTSVPSFSPTVSEPSLSPTRWFDPRWMEVLDGSTTCAHSFRISRPCRNECNLQQCKQFCADRSNCRFFFLSNSGRCELYSACTETRETRGVTVRKDVIPTNQPSFDPTISAPSSSPSISMPTGTPSVSAPSKSPSVSMPTGKPSVSAPSTSPSTSNPSTSPTVEPTSFPTFTDPSLAPTNWFATRWVLILDSQTKCSSSQRDWRPFRNGGQEHECKEYCDSGTTCNFYYFRPDRGFCELFTDCVELTEARSGVSYQKITIPTNEPSHSPSVSMLTSAPSSSMPTSAPSSSLPTSAPTTATPTSSPTLSEPTALPSETPTRGPTFSQPTAPPSHWYDPRWVQVLNRGTMCSPTFRFARPCKSGCSEQECKDYCASRSQCRFFWRSAKGRCELFNNCADTVERGNGITVRKDTIPTNEPSYSPTLSQPTGSPSISSPTKTPTTPQPTTSPTVDPTQSPSNTPTGFPTTSNPSKLPTTWDTPRWHYVFENEGQTCSRRERLSRACEEDCSMEFCRQLCADNENCGFFHHDFKGRCELYRTCKNIRSTRTGSTWRKELLAGPLDG